MSFANYASIYGSYSGSGSSSGANDVLGRSLSFRSSTSSRHRRSVSQRGTRRSASEPLRKRASTSNLRNQLGSVNEDDNISQGECAVFVGLESSPGRGGLSFKKLNLTPQPSDNGISGAECEAPIDVPPQVPGTPKMSTLKLWGSRFKRLWSIIIREPPEDSDFEADDTVMQSARHKPESLDALVKMTNFSKQELQVMYRGFKQHCPTGMVSEETFKDIFAHFFVAGESDEYAHLVFRIFDTSKTGMVTFEQFVMALSILSRGSLDDRLRWTFTLYDVNKDGFITREDMQRVVTAVYHMMGKWCQPSIDDNIVENHVDYVFKKMDLNKDGIITLEEFMTSCKMDDNIIKSMASLDTVL